MQLTWKGLVLCLFITACTASSPTNQQQSTPVLQLPDRAFDVLVFSKTVGWRHDSIEAGIAAIRKLGDVHDFSVTATEESDFFSTQDLTQFEAIVFLNTTLDIFNETEQKAFQAYIQQGGGFVGVHGAADTEYDWPWYGELVGAYFASHPDRQNADVIFTDRHHPATASLPVKWNHFDEWYNYKANPRANVHVLAVVEEQSYEGGEMGFDHPIAWAHHYDGGRAFYTGLGHTIESYSNEVFLDHLTGGIMWAAGQEEADVTATLASSFDETMLTGALTDPMEIDITNDGRVFIIEWAGAVKIWEPETNAMRVIGWLPVEKKIEDGLLGLALDPDFDDNGWVYIFYSPIANDKTFNQLSRFTYDGAKLDMDSEVAILQVPNQRTHCCHSAGSVQFDHHGDLWLSTGDNSGGDRDSEDPTIRRHADQGRTAANTNDLRGKILRITPQPDGSYTIPEGNLFPEGTPNTRPEIYTMGHRNPFRYSIDSKTGWLYWGDVGPGGGDGYDEFNQARQPGFFGWPLFTGRNVPYDHYHFAGGKDQMDAYKKSEAPINASQFNTGLRELPPAQPSIIPYLSGTSEEFPELGAGGLNPMSGPIFHFDPETASDTAFPPYYDNKWMIYEWMRNWVMIATLDEQGDLVNLDPFLPGNDYISPIDIEVGPDGRLYILEWGTQFWGSNPNAQLVRLDYRGNRARAPMLAETLPAREQHEIKIQTPQNGGFFGFDESIEYKVNLSDQALAEHAYVQTYTGFDTSPYPLERKVALEGELSISEAYTHDPNVHFVDRFAVVEACLVDGGAKVCDAVHLNPKTIEAEHTSAQQNASRKPYGVRPATEHWGNTSLAAMTIRKNAKLEYNPINLAGIQSLTFRFLPKKDVEMKVHLGEHSLGNVMLSANVGESVVPNQGAYVEQVETPDVHIENLIKSGVFNGWREVTLPIMDPGGTHNLTLSFASEEAGTLVELDLIRFNGSGVSNASSE